MKRNVNKSEFIRNAALEAAYKVEKGEYPFPNVKPLAGIGWGSCRLTYRIFWNFCWIHSTAGRVEREDLSFKAKRIFGRLWWVDRKSFDDRTLRSVGCYDRITITPKTP
jgi:hypothetical protein